MTMMDERWSVSVGWSKYGSKRGSSRWIREQGAGERAPTQMRSSVGLRNGREMCEGRVGSYSAGLATS